MSSLRSHLPVCAAGALLVSAMTAGPIACRRSANAQSRAPWSDARDAGAHPAANVPPAAPQTPAPPAPGDASLLALVDGIEARVSEIRQLAIVHPIARGVLDRDGILAHLHERVGREYGPGEVALEGETLRRLGIIPEPMNYESTVYGLLEEQVAGFYDPDDRRLFIARWVPEFMQTITMAHEIVHALQDQHFGLARFTHHLRGRGDAQTAAMAVVEGDATLSMFEYSLAPLHQSVRMLDDPASLLESQRPDPSEQPRLAAAPRGLRDMLMFPYGEGLRMCAHAFRAGGFAAIDALLTNPPASTEQVLHADKLAAREPPIVVPPIAPADLADDLLVDDDVLGELTARLYLVNGNDDRTAFAAAAGWGGDRAMLFVPRASGVVLQPDGHGATIPPGALATSFLVWKVVFDPAPGANADAEAEQFEQAASRTLHARYASAPATTIDGASAAVSLSPTTVSFVARRGRETLVVDRAPTSHAAAIVRGFLAGARRTVASPAH